MISVSIVQYVASAGGGSSGGSGGGDILGALGYLAGYYPTKFFKKNNMLPVGIGISVGLIIALTLLFMTFSFFFAVINLVAGGIGIYSAISGVFGKWKKRAKVAETKITAAALADPTWNPTEIVATTSQLFAQFQADWGSKNLTSMKQYLAPSYYIHVQLMLYALRQMNRTNLTTDITFTEKPLIVDVQDVDGKTGDRVTVAFSANAKDQLIDATTNTILQEWKTPIVEAWYFNRIEKQWQLEAIEPNSSSMSQEDRVMRDFATQHNMFFSVNWGRLLLPRGGQLFNKASFTNSLVTNHIIGMWEGNLLIQLYRYAPASSKAASLSYDIGQITLPKTYGGIIIKRSGGMKLFSGVPNGYQKVSMEWGDFNKRYDVYATDMERVTTFELLHPAFMAWLYDQNLHVDIEVIENVVYIYAKNTKQQRYGEMMEILKRAYKELKR